MQHRLTDAKTLDRAQEALSSDVRPDSVELLKDGERARIWFDLGELLGESLGEYCHHVPGRWFWGRKKREKWEKENRIVRREAAEKVEQELYDLIGPLVDGRRGFFNTTYSQMNYSANLSIKGGPNAVVERDPTEDRAAAHFILTAKVKEWLRSNAPYAEFCEFGDQAQLFFNSDEDRLNFVKWSSTLNRKKKK